MKSLFLFLPTFLVLTSLLAAQEGADPQGGRGNQEPIRVDGVMFRLGGGLRYRGENDSRSFAIDSEADLYHLLRTRLNVFFQPVKNVSMLVEVQDSRLFGTNDPLADRGTTDGSAEGLDLHQAYIRVKELLDLPVDLTLGRQELAYGDERLIGTDEFSNVGRTFDAGRVRYHPGIGTVDLFAARLLDDSTAGSSQNLYGVYGALEPFDFLAVDAYAFHDDNADTILAGEDVGEGQLSRTTAGLYLHGNSGLLDYNLHGTVQTGTTAPGGVGPRQDIEAYMLSVGLGYIVAPKENFRVGASYSKISGDPDPQDATYTVFNTLFPSNHCYYGLMDIAENILPGLGLQDVALTLRGELTDKFIFTTELHYLALAHAIAPDPQQLPEATLGQELDITGEWFYNATLSFSGGASLFLPDNLIKRLRGNSTAYRIYLALEFKMPQAQD